MSKDKQQRREQPTSVTLTESQNDVTRPPIEAVVPIPEVMAAAAAHVAKAAAVNIPKAIHHLRKAANALPGGDALRPMLEHELQALVSDGANITDGCAPLERIAAAMDLDVHAGGAAKDVRAAIEALS